MSNLLQRSLATGVSKTYYNVESEFEAVGTFYTNASMYYTAAHPTLGLWISGITANNQIVPIGFVDWNNIKRIVVDEKGENVFVVPDDFPLAFNKTSGFFKKVYKKAWTHQMSDTQEIAFVLPLSLWSRSILPFLQERVPVTFQEEKVKVSIWLQILYVLFIVVFIIVLLAKVLSIF